MVLLPLLYIGLVAGVGWCVWKWLKVGAFLLEPGGGGRGMLVKFSLYAAPIVGGAIATFFMIKPLLARRAPAAQPLALSPAAEPRLFALVQGVCDAVGAPFPNRIDLDCQLNAAASFRRGVWSFVGNDLVLTIGLPLVAGLSVRQFAGVLAHEFGHFTQGFGLRLTYLIRSVNDWFVRVVYQKDAWDVWLEEWEADSWYVWFAVVSSKFGVWFSRSLLKILMRVGFAIGGFMLRQMEYDADTYEINLAGSETFETSTKRMAVLGYANSLCHREMNSSWTSKRLLPDNFPAFLLAQSQVLSTELQTQIEDAVGLAQTGPFDTHPSSGDRIRQARQAGAPGIFGLEGAAWELFSNFEAVSKQVTYLHYADDLRLDMANTKLAPVQNPK